MHTLVIVCAEPVDPVSDCSFSCLGIDDAVRVEFLAHPGLLFQRVDELIPGDPVSLLSPNRLDFMDEKLSRSADDAGPLSRVRIPMMPITQSDLMPINAERSDAGLSQCERVIDISQEVFGFSARFCKQQAGLLQ
jgi:hypothetical protein